MLHQLTRGHLLFRGRTRIVVGFWVVTDRPGPKHHQRLLDGEMPLSCLTPLQELEVLHTLEHGSRIHDVKFVQRAGGSGEVLLVAAENKKGNSP